MEWMKKPAAVPDCPPGLEYLTILDQLFVKRRVELLEAYIGTEGKNMYSIKNDLGETVYYAVEETDRQCCGRFRPFDMRIFDKFRTEVLHLRRRLACSLCCFPCCLQFMEISAPPGNVIGTVEEKITLCHPVFRLKNHNGDTVLFLNGPFCVCPICCDANFDVVSLTGENVGRMSKEWSGFPRDVLTYADFFGISFPLDLDGRMKAVLLGALFLIDYMYFEQ